MIRNLIGLLLVINSFVAQAQTARSSTVAIKSFVNHWNLNKNLWSHIHHDSVINGKPIVDFDAIDNWTGLGEQLSVSRDGQYFAYAIERGPLYYKRLDTLVVQSTTGEWREAMTGGAKPGFFSGDSKQYIYQDQNDLCFLHTGGDERQYIKDVAGYTLPHNSRNDWFAYQLKDSLSTVILHNLKTGNENRFTGVASYAFDEKIRFFTCQLNNELKELIVCKLATEHENRYSNVLAYLFSMDGNSMLLSKSNGSLEYINLTTGKETTLWSQDNVNISLNGFNLDKNGNQAVFVINDKQSKENTIWYWKEGMDKAVMKVNNQTAGIGSDLLLGQAASFTDNGKYVQFVLQPMPDKRWSDPDAAQVDVWSYQDMVLQSTQQSQLAKPRTFAAILNPTNGFIIQLSGVHEELVSRITSDYAIVAKKCCGDRFWERDYGRDSIWLVSLNKGIRKLLPLRRETLSFSPDGRYLVYFDGENGCNYFSYDLSTGKIIEISAGTSGFQFGKQDCYLRTREKPKYFVGMNAFIAWIGDVGLIVYDDYDVWQLDITGKDKPISLTNGYGRTHHIKFELSGEGGPYRLSINDTLLLKAFNRETKDNGYYRKILGRRGNPELLYMGPCFMERLTDINVLSGSMSPVKAADVSAWLVRRETATDAPNYFLTHDFKGYAQLTYLTPQKAFNWYTTELHNFKQLDGSYSQGVLYKPENFDPQKKYPVIISFYTNLSDNLYQYAPAEYIHAPHLFDNPAWMVSHGYLVFVPDIYFTQGKWGPSTLNTMDAAAKYLRTLSYVDGEHLGAVGHSNSGRFGYYLLTHSNSFAAMSVGAGATNMISAALSIKEGSFDMLEWAEIGSVGTGLGNIWENIETWLNHTSVLHADKATTPLLLFHNREDGAPVEHAVAMYVSLRRLQKKCWWLQYDQGGHTLDNLKDLRDFTIRYTQYFDHYLKQAPAPHWMTQGIPAALKTIESRYELDPSGNCDMEGKTHCNLCEAWNKQYKRNPAMFEKEIKDWKLDKDLKEELDSKTKAERLKLDREQVVEDKKIVNILRYGYPGDKRTQKN